MSPKEGDSPAASGKKCQGEIFTDKNHVLNSDQTHGRHTHINGVFLFFLHWEASAIVLAHQGLRGGRPPDEGPLVACEPRRGSAPGTRPFLKGAGPVAVGEI